MAADACEHFVEGLLIHPNESLRMLVVLLAAAEHLGLLPRAQVVCGRAAAKQILPMLVKPDQQAVPLFGPHFEDRGFHLFNTHAGESTPQSLSLHPKSALSASRRRPN